MPLVPRPSMQCYTTGSTTPSTLPPSPNQSSHSRGLMYKHHETTTLKWTAPLRNRRLNFPQPLRPPCSLQGLLVPSLFLLPSQGQLPILPWSPSNLLGNYYTPGIPGPQIISYNRPAPPSTDHTAPVTHTLGTQNPVGVASTGPKPMTTPPLSNVPLTSMTTDAMASWNEEGSVATPTPCPQSSLYSLPRPHCLLATPLPRPSQPR